MHYRRIASGLAAACLLSHGLAACSASDDVSRGEQDSATSPHNGAATDTRPTEPGDKAGPDDLHDDYAAYVDGAPDCSDFWVEGERMPKGYGFCEEGSSMELHNAWTCAKGELIAQTRGYAWVGGPIMAYTTADPSQDPAFIAAVRDNDCQLAHAQVEPGQPFVAAK